MEFLKIYDVTKDFKNITEDTNYERYFIQEDTHVFHIFRIIQGNYLDEDELSYWGSNDEGYTVERENISKREVLETLGFNVNNGFEFKNRFDIENKLSGLDFKKKVKGVINTDEQLGYANYDFHVYETVEDCVKYKVHVNNAWEIITI